MNRTTNDTTLGIMECPTVSETNSRLSHKRGRIIKERVIETDRKSVV